jgi:hypothetical protein
VVEVDEVVVVSAWITPGMFGEGTTAAMALGENTDERARMPMTDTANRPAHRRMLSSSPPFR